MNKLEKVVNLYKEFDMYESISDSFVLDNGKQPMRQAKVSDLNLSQDSLTINVDRSMINYLRNIVSPTVKNKNESGEMEDINKLHLALAVCKIYFEEKDVWYYLPLVTVDLTDKKQSIFNGQSIILSSEEELIVNDTLLNVLQSNQYSDGDSVRQEYTVGVVGDILADSIENIINGIYSMFKFSSEFVIRTPKIVNNSSAVFMFFNFKNNIKIRREYDNILSSPSSLVQEYIEIESEEKDGQSLDNTIWYGSLTKDYPLGEGQAIVMQKNESNKNLIAVAGGPGTGKTTLFLSLIAQEVTKRAINIARNGQDKSNLMLITSTSNKAIENVYTSLFHGFKTGFCYVGGSKANKDMSIDRVNEYIARIEGLDFDPDRYQESKNKIEHYLDMLKEKEEIFNKVKAMNLNVSEYKDLEFWLNNNIEKPTLISAQNLYLFKQLLGNIKDISKKLISILDSEKYLYFKEKSKIGLFSKFFGKNKGILTSFNSEFNVQVQSNEELDSLFQRLDSISSNDVRNYIHNEKIKNVKSVIKLVKGKEKFFNGILKYNTFSEYFRTNLFGMNYSLYIYSLQLMEQEVLKEKEEVLKAVKYFIDNDPYQYIMSNYGYRAVDHEKFLRYLSMAFPVVTSTLAAIGNMFQGIKSLKFNKVLADEAGMISVHHILPTLQVSKSAIIVGDVKQLEAITNVQDVFLESLKRRYDNTFWNMYAPNKISAYHRAAGTKEGGFKLNGSGIILDEHRRCAPKIANLFIDIAEYKNLKVCTKQPNNHAFKNIGTELLFFNTKNSDTKRSVKINIDEINKISKILNRLHVIGFDLTTDVGIITPYKQQEKVLIDNFAQYLNHGEEAKIGTVHKFQGAEFKVIIFSSVVSRDIDSLQFINNSVSMMNVALSRAKQIFIMVGDYEKLTHVHSQDNFIGRVAEYIKKNGKYVG